MKILTVFLLLTCYGYGQGTWIQKNSFSGVPRYGAVGFTVNGKGYFGLGRGNSLPYMYKDLWEYNPSTDAWAQKADFPGGPREGAVGIAINTRGYVGTGMDYNQIAYKDWWEYNPLYNTWVQKASFPAGNRVFMVGYGVNSAGYIGTGSNETTTTFNDWWKYNPSSNSWQQLTSLPGSSRCIATGFSLSDSVYVGTGLNLTNGTMYYLEDFWRYDPATDSWQQKNNFPGGKRSEAHGFSLGNSGYLGLGTKLVGSGTVADFWRYNAALDSWQQISDFGGGLREMVAGFTINCKHYVCAGFINDQDHHNDLWEFGLDTCNSEPLPEPELEYSAYFIPNVFTPNGDEMNDFWSTNFLDASEYMIIVNRWGQTITTLDLEHPKWDGTSKGEPCQEGVYFYRGVMRGESKSGFFHLMR